MQATLPMRILLLLVPGVWLAVAGCGQRSGASPAPQAITNIPSVPSKLVAEPAPGTNTGTQLPVYTYEIVNTYPHDRGAFTQGLVFLNGEFLESTGLNGQSSLRRVELKTGRVIQQVDVPSEYFAEGLAVMGRKAFQLTWQNGKGFVYDIDTFRKEQEFSYDGEGWGLATDGKWLLMSDGTQRIRFLDPVTLAVKRTINVQTQGKPVIHLNELEYVKGEIFANLWPTDYLVRIDPATGNVTGVVDFTHLLPAVDRDQNTDVLNGIAYDLATDRLFVTGKRWPKLYEVRLRLK
jgi:glutamine cyclotransferase